MSLLTSLISHQIWLQRAASGEVKDLAPFIQGMRDEIKRQVLLFGDDGRSTARLNKLLRDLEEALTGLTGDWQTKLTADLKELAAYEAEWNVKTLSTNVNAEFVTPTAEQVWAAAEFQPLQLSDKPVDFTKLMSGWGETEVARLVTGVKMGFVQGQTTRQIVKNVVGAGGLADISERNAATVIRTALSHVSNEARNETYRQNDDIIEKYEWVSTLDSRTSTTCFTAETELAPIAGMDAVMRGLYSGKILTIELSNGEKFSGTPKHPVLTQYGWTPLDELDPTKHVLYTTVDKVTVLETVKNINMPARADYIFNTLTDFPIRKMVSTSPAATDFYGDGVGLNGKIDIVRADCKLRNYVHASGIKQFKSEGFSLIHSAALLSDDSSGDFLLRGECPVSVPALSEAKCFDHRIENCFADLGPSYALNRRDAGLEQFYSPFLIQNGVVRNPTTGSIMHESELLEKCCYRGGSDAVILGYDAGGSAISVQRTNIIRISVEFRTCHVYTLSSSQGYYTAGSAIVKNCRARDGMTWEIGKGPMPPAHFGCRSTTAPVISSEFDFLDKGAKRAAKGADGGMQVSADTTYYEFLKQQPAWFQDQALGPVRGKIFRNSGISPEEFRVISVDGFGNPLTLKQMAELDKRVADYLKGD